MNWTKGKWELDDENSIYCDNLLIASVGPAPLMHFSEEIEANAALLCAAPELYEALEAVVEELLELDAMPIPSNVYRKARAALAKARGEV